MDYLHDSFGDKETFMNVFGWVGNTLALFFYLSPLTLFYSLIKSKIDISIIPWVLLFANCGNCIIWSAYGILDYENRTQIYVCNGVGSVINVVYVMIWVIYKVEKDFKKSILLCFAVVIGAAGVFCLFYFLSKHFDNDDIAGKTAMICNIIMYGAPGQKLVSV